MSEIFITGQYNSDKQVKQKPLIYIQYRFLNKHIQYYVKILPIKLTLTNIIYFNHKTNIKK